MVKIIISILILGLLVNPYLFSNRYTGIIWNANMLSSFSVLCFGLLFLKHEKKTNLDIFLLVFLFIVSISTGSRLSLLGIFLLFLFEFGFSFRNIIYSIIGLILFILIASSDLQTSFNRFASQSFLNDRTEQFKFGIQNLKNKLWTGYGLSEYSGFPLEIDIPEKYKGLLMASHNGYLSLYIQYGLIFGSIVIFIILRKSFLLFFYFYRIKKENKIFIFIVLFTLIASMFETLLTGINEFQTLLFWFSLSYLSHSKFLKDYAD